MSENEPQEVRLTVKGRPLQRAARLAEALTADPEMEGEWTVQDVLNVALNRGLSSMFETYGLHEGSGK